MPVSFSVEGAEPMVAGGLVSFEFWRLGMVGD